MSKLTKKQKAQVGKIDSNKLYALTDALGLVKEFANAKFDESIDVAVQLGIDAKKSDQVVRGAVVLPNGTGKTKRVAVFAQGAKAEEAKAAGADIVGMDYLAAMVKASDNAYSFKLSTLPARAFCFLVSLDIYTPSTFTPMERAVPAMVRTAASMSAAVRSFILVFAISSS